MDIGQTVQVDAWNTDGTTSVKYRGANWAAHLQEGSASGAGTYSVEQVIGSRLILKKV
jgi:membrane protein implicated in regulation of membrane protease activity